MQQLIGITMGCPVGIGPEIILKLFASFPEVKASSLVVLGDVGVLQSTADLLKMPVKIVPWKSGKSIEAGTLPVYDLSKLNADDLQWGKPNEQTGKAMGRYIEQGVRLVQDDVLAALVTCPITKKALNLAGFNYPGHTEMLAELTGAKNPLMLMAGKKLKVSLVTIHEPLAAVPGLLTIEKIVNTIRITGMALQNDFGIPEPKIGIAALNPHGSEHGMFGNEEAEVIEPAIAQCRHEFNVHGPCPPDTIFHQAVEGRYDAVVAMYHDQGLIPFKLVHFSDGVNVTLGLPIVRTSVDHGTAYDIAGHGKADFSSLLAAVKLAEEIVANRNKRRA